MLRKTAMAMVLCCALAAACRRAAPPPGLRADFDTRESRLEAWDLEGRWQVQRGALACEAGRTAVATWHRVPMSRVLRAEATLTVVKRAGAGNWAAAGLCVWQDGGNYWRLALVEAPTGSRYAELVEMRDGRWQAQSEDGLTPSVEEGKALQWEPGRPYTLALALNPEGVEGTIREAGAEEVLVRIAYCFGHRPAVRKGRLALHQVAIAARWDDVAATAEPPAATLALPMAVRRGPSGAAALVDESALGADPQAVALWRAILQEAGYGVTALPTDLAVGPGVLAASRFDLCVVPDVHLRPRGVADAVHGYLLAGGKAVLCGGPAFGRPMWKAQGKWLDDAGYAAALEGIAQTHGLVDLSGAGEQAAWVCGGSDAGSTPKASIGADAQRGKVLRLHFANYAGWGHAGRQLASPFPKGHMLTVFWAKGSPAANAMMVEWKEADDARWIATVALTPTWQRYVLAPHGFAYWRDNKSVGRGGARDALRCDNARLLRFGLATSHCRRLPKGTHTLWIAGLATAASPVERPPVFDARPRIELVSPPYKTHVIRDAVRLQAAPTPGVPAVTGASVPKRCYSPVTRFAGRGFGRGSRLRWVRWLDAVDAQGTYRGAPLSLLVNWRAPFYGGAWATLGTADAEFIGQKPVRAAVVAALRRLSRGVFLVEGGTAEFACRRDEAVLAGARVANFGRERFRGRVVVELVAPSGEVAWSRTLKVSVQPGDVEAVSCERRLRPTDGLFHARVRLMDGGRELDRVGHTFQFMPDLSREEWVTVRDGDFWLGGKRWFPVGINFWPRSCAGLEPQQFGTHWLDPAYYDPDAVEQDIARLAALGCNMVSISCSDPAGGRNLNDFVLRCRRHGVRVNLFIGGLDPLGGGPEPGLRLIEGCGIADNPFVFAYDIAWEPRFFGRGKRFSWARFDPAWRQWLADQYGSVAAAERAWGCKAPREGGEVVSPTRAQLRGQGGCPRMIAAFHRFFCDHVGERYARVIRRIRQAVPRQLVGFRGQDCRVPSGAGLWPMHSPGTMKCTDFISPEGYGLMRNGAGRKTDWAEIRRGGLTTVYLRRASGGKPIFWSEFGAVLYGNGTRWRDSLLDQPPERFAYQVAELGDWAKMLVESGANGAAPWWFCGGFRTNEGSDWGLFHPDGTPRPCTQVFARIAHTISQPRRAPQAWIYLDFDVHPFDSWQHFGDQYLALAAQGKAVGVRLPGEGTDSTTCPDLAVGNVPWKGAGPAKCLNAMFEAWTLAAGEAPTLEVIVANTGIAEWADAKSAAGKPGAVELIIQADSMTKAIPIPKRVPYLGELTIGPVALGTLPADAKTLRVRLRVAGRGEFGSVLRIPVGKAKR